MSKFKIQIHHELGSAEAIRRIKKLVEELQKKYATHITEAHDSWKGANGTFSLSAMGYDISGAIKVLDKTVTLDGDLPWSAGLFKGKIESVIKERAIKLLKK